jgi:phage-related protein|nr:MAG TPA: minor tail protein [Caudoviricetes sp.]
MVAEEIEIIVTAKVEEALKEFEKMLPAIKNAMKQAQEAFSKVDTKAMTNKLHQAVNFMKKKMQDLKKSSENNEIAIKVNNKDAQKQISQIQKQIDSLQEKINARQIKLNVINPQIDKIVDDTRKSVTPEGINPNSKAMDTTVDNVLNSNKDFTSLNSQAQKLYTEIEMYNKQLEQAKSKMAQLEQETNKTATTQNRLSSFFSAFKQKIEQVKPSISNIKNSFKGLPKLTQNITNNIKGMGTGVRNGLGHVLKYAGALVSLRSIYSTLSSCAQSWLSSQNAGAKQLSTNIDYMKYAMGSAFAPVIQYVTGLIYQLMKAIQSVVYALFRVNIFAKASASSYANMAGSAKKAKNETKSLSNIHSEINNVQSNDNSDSGSGGSSSPSFDLSGIDNQMSPLAQKLYDFFKPLVDSWNQYGTQVIEAFKNAVGGIGQAISAMWNSVETLFTNGTIYSIIANILNSIGQIGVAWANAWNNDNNGTEIVQGIANMIDDITNAILNLVSSTGFQSFLDGVLSAFSGIVQFIEPIVSGFSEMAEKILEIVLSSIGDVLKTVGDALQTIAQNKTVSEILKAVGGAIAIVVGAIVLWNIAQAILNGLMGLFAILTSPITLIILAVIAAITAIIVVVKNWGTISEWFQNLWVKITEKLQEIWNNIKLFFVNLWNSIIDKIKTVWNGIKDFLSNLWNGILNIVKTVFSAVATFFSNVWNNIRGTALAVWTGIKITISTVITNIKDKISTVLNNIKTVWNNIWTTIGNVVKNIWNGIWSGIKGIINSILGGIEGFVNGTIKGINKLLSGISSVANAVGSLIGLNPISLQISTISLPRLAKGGVLTEATTVLAGEYSGARTNPEIVTPQNIMRDTFEDVLSDFNSGNGQQVHITIQYLGKEIFDDTIDYINSKTRRTGKNTIVTVGD